MLTFTASCVKVMWLPLQYSTALLAGPGEADQSAASVYSCISQKAALAEAASRTLRRTGSMTAGLLAAALLTAAALAAGSGGVLTVSATGASTCAACYHSQTLSLKEL